MRITWRMRVAAALVLAFLLGVSDGSALWSEIIPAVLTAGAIVFAVVMLLSERRAATR